MVAFFDFPNELLLNIVDHVRGPDDITRRKRYADLSHLSLTSRRLRSMAQDALFEYVVLRKRFVPPGPRLTELALFLRTLLEQPGFGHKVHHLRIELLSRPVKHTSSCRGPGKFCSCGWEEIVQLCILVLPTIKALDGTTMRTSSWSRAILAGYPFAQLGFVLMLTSQLRSLALVENKELGNRVDVRIPAPCIVGIFGRMNYDNPTLDLATVPGFAKLIELSCDVTLSPELLRPPALRAFKMTLGCGEYDAIINALRNWEDEVLSTTVQRLMIDLNYTVLFPDETLYISYFHKLLRGLPCLTHLFVQISDELSWWQNVPAYLQDQKNSTYLFSDIGHKSLEVLSVDTSAIDQDDDHCIKQDGPISNSPRFPKLRHLVAPRYASLALDIEVAEHSSRVESKAWLESWREGWNKF